MKKLIIVMAILLTSYVEKRVEVNDMIISEGNLIFSSIRWAIIKC